MSQKSAQQIIERAQREVAARRVETAQQRWGGVWSWLFLALLSSVLVAFLLAPRALPEKLFLAMGGVSGLRPAHSFVAGDLRLPLEARTTGMYGGFTLAFVSLAVLRRVGARRLGSPRMNRVIVAFFAIMIFDGINSTLATLGWPHLYTPTNPLRLFTGVLFGTAMACSLIWLVGMVGRPRTDESTRYVLQTWWNLGILVTLNLLFAFLVMQEQTLFYYPIALVSTIGVVGALTMGLLLLVLTLGGMAGRVTHMRYIVAPSALAALLACAILAGAAAMRWL